MFLQGKLSPFYSGEACLSLDMNYQYFCYICNQLNSLHRAFLYLYSVIAPFLQYFFGHVSLIKMK